jgi:hypothetical protein
MGSIEKCVWGKAIEEAYAIRPARMLPKGWVAVFEAHLDCAPGVSYYLGKPEPFGSIFCAHGNGVEVEGRVPAIQVEEFRQITACAMSDSKWLAEWEGRHVHICQPLIELLEKAVVEFPKDERARAVLAAARTSTIRSEWKTLLRSYLPPAPVRQSEAFHDAMNGIRYCLEGDG